MASPDYYKRRAEAQKKREEARYFIEAQAKVAKEWLSWHDRRKDAEARGELFDEPHPFSEEWERRRKEARQSTKMYRLQKHWIWPHILAVAVICAVIDFIALGYGIVWLAKYILSIEGSGTVILIVAGVLFAIVVYLYLWALFSLRYDAED